MRNENMIEPQKPQCVQTSVSGQPICVLDFVKSTDKVPIYKKTGNSSCYHKRGDLVVFYHSKFITFTSHLATPKLIEGGIYEVDFQTSAGIKLKGIEGTFGELFFATEDKECMKKYTPHYIYDDRFFYFSHNSNFLKAFF